MCSCSAHRDLRSFPTRRSSDLNALAANDHLVYSKPWLDSPTALAAVLRSEEHTSELQSPCNLVCRLLLEKKNTKSCHILVLVAVGHDNVMARNTRPALDSSTSW